MKNKSLVFQIWILFASVIIGISIILATFFPIALRSFFTDEVYKTIEAAQDNIIDKKSYGYILREYTEDENINMRSVVHIKNSPGKNNAAMKIKVGKLTEGAKAPSKIWAEIVKESLAQKDFTKRYSKSIGDRKVFYVITKLNNKDKNLFLFSYMWDTYRDNLVKELLKKLMLITMFSIFISLFIAMGSAKYITSPLIKLEQSVRKIAKQQWNDSIQLDREDEIGGLSSSIEYMRKELIKSHEAQQNMLQNISHELKTPVMIIRSYAEAIDDGIFPKGDLKSTVKVINDEAYRLERQIRQLIYLSKLEYLSSKEHIREKLSIKEIFEDTAERLKFINRSINIEINLHTEYILGNKEQLQVVAENLLENSLRYARKKIDISSSIENKKVIIRIHNDGEPIDEKIIGSLFDKFKKGKNGEFGLGLSIVKRIVELHKGDIWASNEDDGVSFYFKIVMM